MLARRTGRSTSSLAAEAIEAYVDAENWWLDEVERRSWVHEREREAPLVQLVDAFELKTRATLQLLEREHPALAATPFAIGHLTLVCALGYLDFRFPQIDWRRDHPNLTRLYDKLAQRQSFIDTAPPSA